MNNSLISQYNRVVQNKEEKIWPSISYRNFALRKVAWFITKSFRFLFRWGRWTNANVFIDLRTMFTKTCMWIICQTFGRRFHRFWKIINDFNWVSFNSFIWILKLKYLFWISVPLGWEQSNPQNIIMLLILVNWFKAMKAKDAIIFIQCVRFPAKMFNKLPGKSH